MNRKQHFKETIHTDCFESHVDFNGGDLPGYSPRQVDTVFQCQDLCRETPGCRFFTANADRGHYPRNYQRKTCYLKVGPEKWTKIRNHESMSGARDCGKDID